MSRRFRLVAAAGIASLVLGPALGAAASAAGPGAADQVAVAKPKKDKDHKGGKGGKGGKHGKNKGKPLKVMTRNIYLGANINRPVNAALAEQAAGGTEQDILVALANATHETRDIVDQTDFATRAKLLAREIKRTKPDVIGLQEVALWRSGPLETGAVGVPNAMTVDYDYLEMLLDALRARGLKYKAVQVGDRADVEGPSFTGSPFDGSIGGDIRDVRLTMRDVILKRKNNSIKVTGSGDTVFTANLAVPVAGTTVKFDRGYGWIDAKTGGRSVRIVNTHLESFSSDLAYAQAKQMVTEATAKNRSTIIVCDCNSDPLNSKVKAHDKLPHYAAYQLIRSAGYADQWLKFAPAEEGWTSGLSELVNDPTAAGFDHRIDMIFGKTADGRALLVDKGRVTGNKLGDRDVSTGLWPSDHAGVVLRLRAWR